MAASIELEVLIDQYNSFKYFNGYRLKVNISCQA